MREFVLVGPGKKDFREAGEQFLGSPGLADDLGDLFKMTDLVAFDS